jgi:arylsulfatase A-like enzyme
MFKDLVSKSLAGMGAALVAGAIVGFFEGLVVWGSDPAAAAWAPLYGVLFYALLVSGGGLGFGLLAAILAKVRKLESWTARQVWTMSLLVILLPVGLVVARFRVIRDIFHEKLQLASAAGLGVHLGLVVGAAAVGAGLWFLTREREKGLGKIAWPLMTAAPIALMALVSLPFALTGGAEQAPPAEASKGAAGPPVILIMVDTLRADHLNSYGYTKPTSPNMTAFADEAVQFDAAFAQASWTRPSVASLLTSLPPSAHKVMYKPDRLPDSVTTVAEAFDAHGYSTGGLVTNYNIAPYFNFAQGFDSYKYLDPEYYFFADEGSSKLSLYNLARVIREKVAPSTDNPAHYYQDAEVTTDAAISWIDAQKDNPFFLFLTYMDPHDPYFARPLDGEAYARASNVNPDPKMAKRFIEIYDGEIAYWDEHFGRLMAHLKAQGIYDKAVIVVTSDHGEEFQDHGGWWHGTTLYEEQIHVPLVIKMPAGVGSAGFSRDDLARLTDVPPTLTAAAKIKAPEGWHGRDLFGKADAPDTVFAEEDHQGNVLRSLRGPDWKIIEANEDNPRGLDTFEFYKIGDDPKEQKNLASEQDEKLSQWKVALEKAGEGAQVGAVERDQLTLDESSRERLKSLGYLEEEDEKKEPKKDEGTGEE